MRSPNINLNSPCMRTSSHRDVYEPSEDDYRFFIFCCLPAPRYGYHQRENTGSRLFTDVKPCWTGLISGWVTISIKYPVLYSLGSQAGVVDINHAFHLYCNVVCGSSFSQSQPDFEGFLRALRFPPSAKLTPSLIQYAGPH